MGWDSKVCQLCFQIACLLFRDEKSNEMMVADFLRNVIEVKLAGFCLTARLENGSIIFPAFGVEDLPDSLPPIQAVDIRAAGTNGKIMGTEALFEQAG